MKHIFVEVADSFTRQSGKHRGLMPELHGPDRMLARVVCAEIVRATMPVKFTWRGVFCLLRPAV